MPRDIRIMDSITQPDDAPGTVIIAGSHGGVSAGRYAARLGVTGVIFNDAGVGRDEAGLASLSYFDGFGCPAATVNHRSARIADGVDMGRNGTISHVNETAADLGCAKGQNALECAGTMHDADVDPVSENASTDLTERKLSDGEIPIWAVDSISLVSRKHEGGILIAGSHGERLAGESGTYLSTEIAGITLYDAGVGKDNAGTGRLWSLDERGIPAATVDVHSARIGDALSAWEGGVLSHVNETAANIGIERGDTTRDFAKAVRESN